MSESLCRHSKLCKGCEQVKDKVEFSPHHATKDRLRPHCKSCIAAATRVYTGEHPGRQKEYYEANKEKCDEASRNWTQNNKERVRDNQKEWYQRHRASQQAYSNARNKKLRENKERVVDYLIAKYGDIPCMDCGGVFPWCVMDFDHRPGEIKEVRIGAISAQKATPKAIAKVEKEIARCDLVCSNCHRVRTYITRKK